MGNLAAAAKRHREHLHFVLGLIWRVILDRARFGCLVDPTRILAGLSNFIALPSQQVKYFPRKGFCPYRRLQWWRDTRSGMMLLVESEPTKHFIRWPFRITFIADDATGLLPAQLFRILEVIPGLRLLMIEIAFDFAGELTRHEILQRVLFGKARPASSNEEVLRWGNRHSKMAKIYFKPEIGCWRFELELNSRFLNRHRIVDPYDFPRLAEVLASHIAFQTINLQKLMRRLNAMQVSAKQKRAMERFVEKSNGELWSILQLLRSKEIGMTNARRLLDEHPMNRGLKKALKAWAKQWPTRSKRLRN